MWYNCHPFPLSVKTRGPVCRPFIPSNLVLRPDRHRYRERNLSYLYTHSRRLISISRYVHLLFLLCGSHKPVHLCHLNTRRDKSVPFKVRIDFCSYIHIHKYTLSNTTRCVTLYSKIRIKKRLILWHWVSHSTFLFVWDSFSPLRTVVHGYVLRREVEVPLKVSVAFHSVHTHKLFYPIRSKAKLKIRLKYLQGIF